MEGSSKDSLPQSGCRASSTRRDFFRAATPMAHGTQKTRTGSHTKLRCPTRMESISRNVVTYSIRPGASQARITPVNSDNVTCLSSQCAMSSIVNGVGTPSSLYQVFPARHPLLVLGREHPVSQALPRSHNLLFQFAPECLSDTFGQCFQTKVPQCCQYQMQVRHARWFMTISFPARK